MSSNQQQTTVSRRQTLRAGGAAAAAVVALGSASSAAAYPGETTLEGTEGFFGGGDVATREAGSALLAGAMGRYQRFQLQFTDPTDAGDIATDIREHVNTNSADYRKYVNDRDLGSDDHEVMQYTIVQDGEAVRNYLVAEYDADAETYDSVTILAEDEYDSQYPDRDPDEKAVLEGAAAREAPDDLDELHEEFIGPNEDVSTAFKAEMAGKYVENRNVSSTLLGDDL